MPAKPQKARKLLRSGEAVVVKRMPFTIRLKKLTSEHTQPLDLKLDPGSKYTGVAVVANDRPVYLAEIEHKGSRVRDNLKSRSACRRRRRSANLRYRCGGLRRKTPLNLSSNQKQREKCPGGRFKHRAKPEGWLAPSIRNRLENVVTWVRRLSKLVPVTRIVQELVRFDLQKLENAEIQGVEYQQGTLFGYEVREYVLLKWGHKCAYCEAKDVPLELDHIEARSRGGSDRVSNLCTACRPCNLRKSNRPLEEFLKGKPKVLARIKAQMKAPLKDAAAVNSTRWALRDLLKTFGVEVAVGTGGRTKWNRTRLGVPKGHAYDALCVGEVDRIRYWNIPILFIKSIGRGSHKLVKTDAYGFPKAKLGPGHPRKRHMFYRDPGRLGQRKPEIVYPKGELEKSRGELGKRPHGFSTGDIVRLPDGVLARVVGARASGSMQVRVFGSDKDRNITFRKLTLVERTSGYEVHL
jgi:5-methylcytosine-specific restriction endonuclease McrA